MDKQIRCTYCKSTKYHKNGTRRLCDGTQKPKLQCNNCHKYFTADYYYGDAQLDYKSRDFIKFVKTAPKATIKKLIKELERINVK